MNKLLFLFLCLFIMGAQAYSQSDISERKKIRYLKKIERKNERYTKKEEKKTKKLLSKLSSKEQALFSDSTATDSLISKNNFSHINERLQKYTDNPQAAFKEASQPLSINVVPQNIDGNLKNYLRQQITTTGFFSDTACKKCDKLKKQTAKAEESISSTSKKLDRLKSIQNDINTHRETLKKYCGDVPELTGKLKEIDKSCYYFNQGMNGYKSLYTQSTGIEGSLIKSLGFNKNYTAFLGQFSKQIPLTGGIAGAAPDLAGYQTKAQVQAMLPQNAEGVTPDVKAMLVSNMKGSLSKYEELRDKAPDVSMFKDKPDFKINPYKGLPLIRRVELGKQFQIEAKNKYYPAITNIGLTLGYKLIPRLTPFIGASYKLGLGKDIEHMHLSNEGIIISGGFDCKIAYGFSMQCLYEETQRFKNEGFLLKSSQMKEPSFIIGIMNKQKINQKTYSTFMIGYDFFSRKHIPYSTPWVLRMGWQ